MLNFHVVLKTSFVGTRSLFRVLCSGVSISLFGLCVQLMETVLLLIVLVAVIVVGPDVCDWYDPSYLSISFCMPGEF